MATAQPLSLSPEVLALSASPMSLLKIALDNNAAIDVIERIAVLCEKAVAGNAEMEFNDALNRAQKEIKRVAPDLFNPQTQSKWASYAALDKEIRPVYLAEGFNLSYDTADCPKPEHVRVICYVSRGRHTRPYQMDIPCDGKGPKGGDVQTKTHATCGASSVGMRYLLKMIFNVAIGEEDRDGNAPAADPITKRCAALANAPNLGELRRLYAEAFNDAKKTKDPQALVLYNRATNARKRELQ